IWALLVSAVPRSMALSPGVLRPVKNEPAAPCAAKQITVLRTLLGPEPFICKALPQRGVDFAD
ncbi:MAG: hypothetical protein IJC51_02570, partial [Eggerthellaceae bacterium]|nr:hypothetical protein [Eggerthellaceae bacterium]